MNAVLPKMAKRFIHSAMYIHMQILSPILLGLRALVMPFWKPSIIVARFWSIIIRSMKWISNQKVSEWHGSMASLVRLPLKWFGGFYIIPHRHRNGRRKIINLQNDIFPSQFSNVVWTPFLQIVWDIKYEHSHSALLRAAHRWWCRGCHCTSCTADVCEWTFCPLDRRTRRFVE